MLLITNIYYRTIFIKIIKNKITHVNARKKTSFFNSVVQAKNIYIYLIYYSYSFKIFLLKELYAKSDLLSR